MAAWVEEFLGRIEKIPNGCWQWTGVVTTDHGYGRFRIDGKNRYAHRLSHQIHKGEIPEGLVIDHLCRNRACVNPDHLEAVTPGENQRRGIRSQLNSAQVAQIRSELTPQIVRMAEEFGATQRTVVLAAIGDTYAYEND